MLDEGSGSGAAGQQLPPPGQGLPPPPNQQLPPQMFTTAAQLLDLTDSESRALAVCDFAWFSVVQRVPNDRRLTWMVEKLMLCLRDGRKLVGVLRSWDQFGSAHPPSSPFRETPVAESVLNESFSKYCPSIDHGAHLPPSSVLWQAIHRRGSGSLRRHSARHVPRSW